MIEISIENKKIGANTPVFLIAEAGINHNGELKFAKMLVDSAVRAKVDAIKFQTYKTNDLIVKSTPKVEYQKANTTDRETFYNMLKKYELSKDDFSIIKDYCQKKEIIFLSTPFDESSVEILEELNVPAYKISSGDMNNFPLLKLICSKDKPILLSTGMAKEAEVIKSVEYIKKQGIKDIAVFQCTTNYPASYEELNLNVIDKYKELFPDLIIGFSDHSVGIEASIAAVTKGVKILEKHFTIDKNMEGPDHKASLDPTELKNLVSSIRNIEKAFGSKNKQPLEKEEKIKWFVRKSIVSADKLKIGETITKNNIVIKRPGYGIPPTEYFKLINEKKKVKREIPKDTVITREDLE